MINRKGVTDPGLSKHPEGMCGLRCVSHFIGAFLLRVGPSGQAITLSQSMGLRGLRTHRRDNPDGKVTSHLTDCMQESDEIVMKSGFEREERKRDVGGVSSRSEISRRLSESQQL